MNIDITHKKDDPKGQPTSLGSTTVPNSLKYSSLAISADISRIFACFPGGEAKLKEILVCNLEGENLSTNILQFIESIIKNGNLEVELLRQWRNNLQKLPDFETNPTIIQVIGILTLYSGEIKHMAYIPDGDRRWATSCGLYAKLGHNVTYIRILPNIVERVLNCGVHTFTIWYWQPNNLFRDKTEGINLFEQMLCSLDIFLLLAERMEIKIIRIGSLICGNSDPDIQNMFTKFIDKIAKLEQQTVTYKKHHLILAANYNAKDDLMRSLQKIYGLYGRDCNITYADVVKYSDLGQQPYPYPDLLIRPIFPSNGLRAGDFLRLTTADTCMIPSIVSVPELTINEIFRAAAIFAHPLIQYRSAEHQYVDTIGD